VDFELATLEVIHIDCTGSCKTNYHTITMAPGVTKDSQNDCIKSWQDVKFFVYFVLSIYKQYLPLVNDLTMLQETNTTS